MNRFPENAGYLPFRKMRNAKCEIKSQSCLFVVPLQAFHIGQTFIFIYEYYHWNGWRKKIGDLASPSLNNGSGHDPLNDIANVRNKFNNLKKKTFIPKSVVSKSVYDKLTSLDIKTVGDVLARGHVEMEALTNTATVSKIDAFMRTMGLSLFPRIREYISLIHMYYRPGIQQYQKPFPMKIVALADIRSHPR